MKEKKIGYFYSDTGEVANNFPVMLPEKAENGFKNFITMTQDDLLDLLNDKGISLTRLKVLFCLVKYADYQNLIFAKQKDMAEAIKIHATHFSSAIKFWREKGMIQRNNEKNVLQLSPWYFWKGKGKTHCELLAKERSKRTAKATHEAKSRTLH